MLQFIMFVATVVGLIFLQLPLFRRYEEFLRAKVYGTPTPEYIDTDSENRVESWEFYYVLAMAGVILAIYILVPWKYTFPAVLEDSYVASYENGKVVKHPYGTWDHLHDSGVFRVQPGASEYGLYIGEVLYSKKPVVYLDGLQMTLEITDLNLFYSFPRAREYGFTAHKELMDKVVADKQKHLFTEMVRSGRAITPDKSCDSFDYYGEIVKAFNVKAREYGFRAVRAGRKSRFGAPCNAPLHAFE